MKLVTAFLLILAASSSAIDADSYVNDTLGFEFTPPVATDQMSGASKFAYQHCLIYLPVADGFAANVNIQLQAYDGTLEEYKKVSDTQFSTAGIQVATSEVEGGVITMEYSGKFGNQHLHWYARGFKKGSMIYLITATSLESRWSSEGPILKKSIDSFKLK